jgi:hypothetical protein
LLKNTNQKEKQHFVTLSPVAPTICDFFLLATALPHTNLKVKYLENGIFWGCGSGDISDLLNMTVQFMKTKSQKQNFAHYLQHSNRSLAR